MYQVQSESLDRLFDVILQLEDRDACYRFFEDICTVKEMQDLAQRIEVARLLRAQMTYNDIAQATGASTATISRVNKCLQYGEGGYELVLSRLSSKE